MPVHTILPIDTFLRVAQVFNWATKRHYVLWFTGEERERHRRIEILLKRLSDKGKLRVQNYGNKKVYIVPRFRQTDFTQINHGLGVTEGLVRLILSDRTAVVIPERKFLSKVRPEFGLVYGKKTIYYEFCTQDNCRRLNVLRYKLHSYQEFITPDHVVLFVMQISKEELKRLLLKLKPEGNFLFTDYETFKSVPLGQQLTAKIYLWEDGNEYQLRPDQTSPVG